MIEPICDICSGFLSGHTKEHKFTTGIDGVNKYVQSLEQELSSTKSALQAHVQEGHNRYHRIKELESALRKAEEEIVGLRAELAIVEPLPVMPPELFHEVSLMKKQLKAYEDVFEVARNLTIKIREFTDGDMSEALKDVLYRNKFESASNDRWRYSYMCTANDEMEAALQALKSESK